MDHVLTLLSLHLNTLRYTINGTQLQQHTYTCRRTCISGIQYLQHTCIHGQVHWSLIWWKCQVHHMISTDTCLWCGKREVVIVQWCRGDALEDLPWLRAHDCQSAVVGGDFPHCSKMGEVARDPSCITGCLGCSTHYKVPATYGRLILNEKLLHKLYLIRAHV